tara:strand:- start:33 stop:278 length:246 start_codon:yes stop_codon:yes gene_type:complete
VKKVIAILLSVIAGIIALIIGKRASKAKKTKEEPPDNKAADVAGRAVQESFEEQVDRIKSATDGDSPAEDLSGLGNARKRR